MAPVEEEWTVNDYVHSKEKAKQLLKAVLPEYFWHDFERKGIITIKGERNEYVISFDNQTEIRDLVSGKHISNACMQLSIPAPTYDRMIAEYLLIKNNENGYLLEANIFNVPTQIFTIAEFFLLVFNIGLFLNFILEVITSTTR